MKSVPASDVKASVKFIANARADGKPFFLWFNPSRMHIITRLTPKYEAVRNRRTAGPSSLPPATRTQNIPPPESRRIVCRPGRFLPRRSAQPCP
jgi:hypothetical protein